MFWTSLILNLIVYFRQKLLNFSLAHCEPNAIEALLHSRSLLQTEVLVLFFYVKYHTREGEAIACILEDQIKQNVLMSFTLFHIADSLF